MSTRATPTIVFDLDGTLVHTVPDIAAALDIALAPYGVTSTSPAEAATMMGDGLSEFFWRALVAKRLSLAAVEADAARRKFIETYSQSPARLSIAYPGIPELLEELRESGALTAVCTNKIEAIAVGILEHLGLRRLFDAVVGYRDDRPMKPDPSPLFEAVAHAGGRIEGALLVGDTGADNGAAIAARVPVVLVSYGYSAMPVRVLGNGTVVDDVASLHHVVMTFVHAHQLAKPLEPRDTDPQYG